MSTNTQQLAGEFRHVLDRMKDELSGDILCRCYRELDDICCKHEAISQAAVIEIELTENPLGGGYVICTV